MTSEKRFVGAKGQPNAIHTLANLIPPHSLYVEPFAGLGTVARQLRPAAQTILIDKVDRPELRTLAHVRAHTIFHQGDGIEFVEANVFGPNAFIYADPPYMLDVRHRPGAVYYLHEMSDADHERLLRALLATNARVLLSGYPSPLYLRMLRGWNIREFQAMTRGGTLARECLWFNYAPPVELHDWRYVGDDWHARTRLKKKIGRAMRDLLSMPPLERGAMFAALGAAMRSPHSPEMASAAAGHLAGSGG